MNVDAALQHGDDHGGAVPHAALAAITPARASIPGGRKVAYIELSEASRKKQQSPPDELVRLRENAKTFDGASPAKRLDPSTVRATRWAARAPEAYESREFRRLVDEISSAGGNVQPIVVRPAGDNGYEIACGHRRHRACLLVGVPVLALIRQMSDMELFAVMHRENEQRKRLSPWEQGVAYTRALTEGLFVYKRRLAESLGLSHTWINICLKIAALPPEVLAAFRTPMEIQPGQATRLAAACTINRQGVVNVARQLCEQQGETRMKASDVVDRLTVTAGQLPSASALFLAGQKVGMSERRSSGRFTVSFSIKQLDEDTCAKVTAAIQLALREVETKFPPGDLSPPLRPALTVVTGGAGDACTSVQDS